MSDPVTNVEIEDVLSSIRRLVSDGDKARTRDPAPDVAAAEQVQDAPSNSVAETESKPDKFVLTPAFMVVGNEPAVETQDNVAPEAAQDNTDEDDQDADWVEEIADEVEEQRNAPQDEHSEEDHAGETEEETASIDADAFDGDDAMGVDDVSDGENDVLELDDMVWGSVDEARKAGIAAVPTETDFVEEADDAAEVHTSDRSDLIASIAELEAAVSNDVEDYEPDGSEVSGEMMGETIAWPGAVARSFEDVQDAEEHGEAEAVADAHEDTIEDETAGEDVAVSFEHRTADAPVEDIAADSDDEDDYGDDDLDGLLDVGGMSLDEDALRALVSEVVREELTGPLGERITRNVRKLVRREIYRILSSQEFD